MDAYLLPKKSRFQRSGEAKRPEDRVNFAETG